MSLYDKGTYFSLIAFLYQKKKKKEERKKDSAISFQIINLNIIIFMLNSSISFLISNTVICI